MWWAGKVKCRVCSTIHVSVVGEDGPCRPASEDNPDGFELDDQECPHCGSAACDPVEEESDAEVL